MTITSSSYISDYDRLQLIEWCNHLTDELNKIAGSEEKNIPKRVIDLLHSIGHHKSDLLKFARDANTDILTVKKIRSVLHERGKRLAEALDLEPIDTQLFQHMVMLKTFLTNPPELMAGRGENTTNDRGDSVELKRMQDALAILTNQLAAARNESNNVRREIKETLKIADNLQNQTRTLEKQIVDTISSSSKTVDAITADLLKKQDDVNKLVGMVSGSTIAGSFAKSAEDERRLANSMRNGSVFLMLTIVFIVGYSFFETSKPKFDWETGIFRLLFSVALSVPAAYLARESSKHRAQQYSHLKVSLDLQAINPYLASLPTEDQHKLKLEVANKIFGSKDIYHNQPESYPININDLVTTIVSRIDIKKDRQKDSDVN